jgi:hypothetical protein
MTIYKILIGRVEMQNPYYRLLCIYYENEPQYFEKGLPLSDAPIDVIKSEIAAVRQKVDERIARNMAIPS